MSLRLDNVSKRVGDVAHIHPLDLELEPGTMNVLLGPTLAGKTTLMRLMAGLDTPDSGAVFWQGKDVTGARIQDRDIAMVYQQFVNYPSLSVFDNIASPLKLQRKPAAQIEARVHQVAQLLKLTPLLDRKPSEISGGQQQRCAIARALAKDVGLVLMDEPLANLDYKLREELRAEIPRLFAASGAIFVYATTEPEEALLLGGNTATMWQGRMTQFGPSATLYRQPVDEITARVYSDPPMNFISVRKSAGDLHFSTGQSCPAPPGLRGHDDGEYRAGFRAHDMHIGAGDLGQIRFEAAVHVTELTGSETFIHVDAAGARWIGVVPGLQNFAAGEALPVHINPHDLFYFDRLGKLAAAPRAHRAMAQA